MTTAETAVQPAVELVSSTRQKEYGSPIGVFTKAATIASVFISHEITKEEVVKVMIAVKLAREAVAHKEDNCVDIAGYVSILNYIEQDDSDSESS